MASIDFTDGSDYVIYQYSGKTFIGKFYKDSASTKPSQVTVSGGTHATLGFDSNCYYIENPAELEIELSIPSTGSAELTWKIKPAFYKELIASNNADYKTFIFTVPKSLVAISNVGGDIIDSTLLAAYEELCF